MKNFKTLLVLILGLFVLQACSDEETAKEGEIEGKWNITDLTFDITLNGEDISELFSDAEAEQFEQLLTASFESIFGGSTIEFKSDGSYSSEASDGSSRPVRGQSTQMVLL